MDFHAFNFHPKVAAGVAAAGFSEPTPIQAQAIPPVLAGQDVMGLAQTGTGKTAAFALPILQRLMTGARGHVRALIVAPTRELAEQIHEAISELGGRTGLRSVTVYGGVNIRPQQARLKRGVEIVVACPGRLLDHLGQGTIDLSRLEVLVLDEGDQMFDMGFLPDIRRILGHLPAKRQTLLFSATMPTEIRRLSRDILRDPVTVQVGSTAPAVTVSQTLYPVKQHLKTDLLKALLSQTETDSVLVFTRTKHRARRLEQQLARAGHRATSLQGNLSQARRKAALGGFRDGTFQVMVATDIAARGIDVSRVSHVVNFDMPDTTEAYIHRIGRTGRATRQGEAFSLVTDEDRAKVRAIEKVLKAPLDRRVLEDFDYTVPAPKQNAAPPRPRRGSRRPGSENRAGGRAKAPAGGSRSRQAR